MLHKLKTSPLLKGKLVSLLIILLIILGIFSPDLILSGVGYWLFGGGGLLVGHILAILAFATFLLIKGGNSLFESLIINYCPVSGIILGLLAGDHLFGSILLALLLLVFSPMLAIFLWVFVFVGISKKMNLAKTTNRLRSKS